MRKQKFKTLFKFKSKWRLHLKMFYIMNIYIIISMNMTFNKVRAANFAVLFFYKL